jgi:hypothetical protein
MSFHCPSANRVTKGMFGTSHDAGNNGLFFVRSPSIKETALMRIIASDGLGWEHVSVSFAHRCPTWAEMCKVKSLFWDAEDAVMQLHPPESEWVNNHSYCLHLWRPVGTDIPRPPEYMVGIKEKGVLA